MVHSSTENFTRLKARVICFISLYGNQFSIEPIVGKMFSHWGPLSVRHQREFSSEINAMDLLYTFPLILEWIDFPTDMISILCRVSLVSFFSHKIGKLSIGTCVNSARFEMISMSASLVSVTWIYGFMWRTTQNSSKRKM